MKWAVIIAFQCACICAEVIIWSPNRLLDQEQHQFDTADATCVVASLFDRSPLGKCFPDNSNVLHLKANAESLSCIVYLSLPNHQNAQYLIGTYADSEAFTLFRILKSAQAFIRLSSGDFRSDTFTKDSRFSSVYIDKNNFQTFELSSEPTVVEVNLENLNPDDIYLIFNRIERVLSKNYVGVLLNPSVKKSWAVLQDEDPKVSSFSPSDVLTWEILVALVIGLMLISVLAFSLELLSKIETPLRFQRRHFDVSKEY